MSLLDDDRDLGTPAPDRGSRTPAEPTIELTIDGQTGLRRRGHVGHARRRPGRRRDSQAVRHRFDSRRSARAACASSRSTDARAPRRRATPRLPPGMSVTTQSPRLERLRRGVMELYIIRPPARLPHLRRQRRLRVAGHGRSGRLARRALRLRRREPPRARQGRVQPVLLVRLVEVHRLLALRPRLRRHPGHVRPHDRGTRLRFACRRRRRRLVPRVRLRVVRRLRPGVPHGDAHREVDHRDGSATPVGHHHLRLLRRGVLVQGRDAGRDRGAHDAVQERWRQRGSLVREGPVRVGLRHTRRPCARADGARVDRRRVASRVLGRGDHVRRRPVARHPAAPRHQFDRRHHVVALHQRRGVRRAAHGAYGVRQQQHRHLRPRLPFTDRVRAQEHLRHLGRHAGLQVGRSVRRDAARRRQPDRRPPGVRLADEAPAARRRTTDRGRSASHRPGSHAARRGRPASSSCGRARTWRSSTPSPTSSSPRISSTTSSWPSRCEPDDFATVGGVRRRTGEQPRGHRDAHRACRPPRCVPLPACTQPGATLPSTTGSASPSTARARRW